MSTKLLQPIASSTSYLYDNAKKLKTAPTSKSTSDYYSEPSKTYGIPVQSPENVIMTSAKNMASALSGKQNLRAKVKGYLRLITLCFLLELTLSIIFFTIIITVNVVKPAGNTNEADVLITLAIPHLFLSILYFVIIRTHNFLYILRTTATAVFIALLLDIVATSWRLYIQIACVIGADPVLSNQSDCKQFVGEDWALFGIGLLMILIDLVSFVFVSKLSRLQDMRFVTLQQMEETLKRPTTFNLKSMSIILLFVMVVFTIMSTVMIAVLAIVQGNISVNYANFIFVAVRTTIHIGIIFLFVEVIFGKRKASDCIMLSFICIASLVFMEIVVLIGLADNIKCKYNTVDPLLENNDKCDMFYGTNWAHFGMNLGYQCLDFLVLIASMLYLGVQSEVIKFLSEEYQHEIADTTK